MISDHAEETFGRLRYLFGGDRPSQTARLVLSPIPVHGLLLEPSIEGWYPNSGSTSKLASLDSQSPTYPVHPMSRSNAKLQ